MSKAIAAKSAKARSTIALTLMRTVKALGACRDFDDCFEMGDGDDVVAHIILRAAADTDLAGLVERRGYGYWLKAGYLDRMTLAEGRSPVVQQAIALQGPHKEKDDGLHYLDLVVGHDYRYQGENVRLIGLRILVPDETVWATIRRASGGEHEVKPHELREYLRTE